MKGLKNIHERDIIHLDLKPTNILVKDNHYKLADFGLATFLPVVKEYERDEGDRTYIAPEVLKGQYDASADIFRYLYW